MKSRSRTVGEQAIERGSPERTALSVSKLTKLALEEGVSEDEALQISSEISHRGLPEVLSTVEKLLGAETARQRSLGATILGRLASSGVDEKRAAAATLLLRVIKRETDPDTLAAAAYGLGHAQDNRALGYLVRLSEHEHAEVRLGVAFALPPILALGEPPDSRGVEALIMLASDPDDDVRDWATFGLGLWLQEVDTPAIRRVLRERCQDNDPEIQCEALEGLGLRGDLEALAAALTSCAVRLDTVMAAEQAASPDLYQPLLALKSRWEGDIGDLEKAIAACSPQPRK